MHQIWRIALTDKCILRQIWCIEGSLRPYNWRMTAQDGASQPGVGDEWLTAAAIVELTGGRVKANTVRHWWKTGALGYEVFPELGPKSNKRSHRRVVEQFLHRKWGMGVAAGSDVAPPPAHGPGDGVQAGRVADLLDTNASLRASAAALMEALIVEAETSAELSAARAAADARRVEQLRHLQTMLRGYDMALATHLQPSVFDAGATESVDSPANRLP